MNLYFHSNEKNSFKNKMNVECVEMESDSLLLKWNSLSEWEGKRTLSVKWNAKIQKEWETAVDLSLNESLLAPITNVIKKYAFEICSTSKSWTVEGDHGLVGPYKSEFQGEHLGLCWDWFIHWSPLLAAAKLADRQRLILHAIEKDMLSWRNKRQTTIYGGVFAQFGCLMVDNMSLAFQSMREYCENAGKTYDSLSVNEGKGCFSLSNDSDEFNVYLTDENHMEIASHFNKV